MRLADFLRSEHDEIIAAWGMRARILRHARTMPGLVLLNHMPDVLEALAKRFEGSAPLAVEATALEHAVDRRRSGAPLHEVVSEYAILRDVIEERYAQRHGEAVPPSFERVFDDAAAETIALYRRADDEPLERRPR